MNRSFVLIVFTFAVALFARPQTAPPIPEPDSRYKVDILVIVGHPDDDVEVASYLAKAIEHAKKVAISSTKSMIGI